METKNVCDEFGNIDLNEGQKLNEYRFWKGDPNWVWVTIGKDGMLENTVFPEGKDWRHFRFLAEDHIEHPIGVDNGRFYYNIHSSEE